MANPESIINYKGNFKQSTLSTHINLFNVSTELFVQYFIDNHYEEILDIIKAPDQASSYSVYLE